MPASSHTSAARRRGNPWRMAMMRAATRAGRRPVARVSPPEQRQFEIVEMMAMT
jgi:hypothetical protein